MTGSNGRGLPAQKLDLGGQPIAIVRASPTALRRAAVGQPPLSTCALPQVHTIAQRSWLVLRGGTLPLEKPRQVTMADVYWAWRAPRLRQLGGGRRNFANGKTVGRSVGPSKAGTHRC
jgi:hypothetical protein